MKKIFTILLILTLILTSFSVFAEESQEKVTVIFNGEQMEFDVDPVIEDGRTLVPFRAIFESLGCTVTYRREQNTQFVMAKRGESVLFMAIGQNFMVFDNETIPLDVPAKIVNDRTLVPVRAVSEAFDTKVDWDGATRTVKLLPKRGDHKITPVTISETITDDNGTNLMDIIVTYPVIENTEDNEFIDKLNDEFKSEAEDLALKQAEGRQDIISYYESKSQVERDMIFPLEYSVTYDVSTDREGLFSITNYIYSYNGEKGTEHKRESKNYNLDDGTDLKLTEILSGNRTEINKLICEKTVQHLSEKLNLKADGTLTEKIRKEASNVSYYLTDDSLVVYFTREQIPEVEENFITVEIIYNKN